MAGLIPAELISGAQVYKSAQAPLQGGGIGATINVQTPRPLALKGFKGIVTGKALYEKNSDKFTPQGFALLSDTFADGRLGLLGSISYQRRIAQVAGISNDGFMPNSTVGPSGAGQTPLATGVYAPRNQDVNETRVAGALEIPLALQWMAQSGRHDALVAIGAMVRGETYHFEVVANESARGVMDVALEFGIPVSNGILTADDEAQALARADKGAEAVRVAIEMARLRRRFAEH